MENFFTGTLGISENVFSYVLLPFLIFLARIMDVSINTIRIIYVLGGRKLIATLLGFFESFIWLMAIRQIFEHMDNWICYVAYPAGFATGILVGMLIEEQIAYGKVIVRIITRKDVTELADYLKKYEYRYTRVQTEGFEGPENLVFTVLPRENLEELLQWLRDKLPTAFYTVEKVNRAAESKAVVQETARWSIAGWLKERRGV
ncbi:MAG: DUF5698 domain-containing protein [Cyclobacteriaceae bacterium]|nr:DUF5698 domain-containing protein [Cyclobacteriaceae bacterium]MCX7637694.1 DUF5698 domain-containing protein [Cyclobacteriaceae bacterium]MDW8330841.1 DUF5698 domain-containing protein [Cyclobacteriaceae bacterium]